MSEIIDRMVRAAVGEISRQTEGFFPIEIDGQHLVDDQLDLPALSRAMLAAAREPDEAMFCAGVLAYMKSTSGEAVNDAFRAMVDEALKP